MNSCPIVVATMAQRPKHSAEPHSGTPSAQVPLVNTTAARTGHRNCARMFSTDDFRHASSGPMPVRNSSVSPIGVIHLLKNGVATVTRWPVIASLSVGNIVANRIRNARSEEHTSELQSQSNLVCRLLLEKKKHQHTNKLN